MKSFGHRRPIRNESGEIIGHQESPVRAVTAVPLDGSFGPDRGRRLILTCKDKELVTIRPFGTRRESAATASDIYRWMLKCEADKRWSQRMKEKKERLADQRQRRAERRLTRKS